MGIPLRVAEFTLRYQRSLRRFTFGSDKNCPSHADGYNWGHDASVVIGHISLDEAAMAHGDNWPHDDPRWPVVCTACGYVFQDEDRWQRNDCQVYRLPDGTEFVNWGSLRGQNVPPGTCWRIPWADEHFSKTHPQQVESWQIVLPDGGTWITSQAASGGGHWTVTGTPPMIDVSPSIWHNQPDGWHGFIRNGELVNA